MALFGQTCFPTAYKKETPNFHREVYNMFQDESQKRVVIAAPRGTAKSTICSLILPLWKVAFKKSTEDLFIVIISESRAQSINFLSRIKYHLNTSTAFKTLFGDLSEATHIKWREDEIVLANGARIVAAGTGQRIRGFIEGDTRPNLIIMDDFESEKNANTPEARAKNKKWLTEAVEPSLSDDGRLIVIGTVISEDCFLYWAKASGEWETMWYEICGKNMKDNLLWPEKFPIERVMKIRNGFASVGNLNGFFQEYMNEAQAPENAPFKPAFMKHHHLILERDDRGQWYLTDRPESEVLAGETRRIIPVDLYQGIDPASSLSLHADYFVIVTLALDKDGTVYMIDIFMKRLNPADQPAKIIELFKKYRPRRVRIETVAYQEALRSNVRAEMQRQNLYIPGLEKGLKPRTPKNERLFSLVPLFARKKFFLREEDIEVERQFLSYPKGKHDDAIDAIWMALQNAKPCRAKEISNGKVKKKPRRKKYDWHLS